MIGGRATEFAQLSVAEPSQRNGTGDPQNRRGPARLASNPELMDWKFARHTNGRVEAICAIDRSGMLMVRLFMAPNSAVGEEQYLGCPESIQDFLRS